MYLPNTQYPEALQTFIKGINGTLQERERENEKVREKDVGDEVQV